jgi:FOG: Transposase and inactivated derivatives
MSHHNTVLSQLLRLVPRHEFDTLGRQYDGKRRSDALPRWSQFVALATGHLGERKSLRDITATLDSQSARHYHLGCRQVTKSALGRANEQLDHRFYCGLFSRLYARCEGKGGGHPFRFKGKLFSLDGSLFNVAMEIFPWANYNNKKAAFKLHLGLDHDGLIPAFASVTLGKESEMSQARLFDFPKGSVVVFDKGYNDYTWHDALTDKGVFFVTRIRGNAVYDVIDSNPVREGSGVLADEIIRYSSKKNLERKLKPVRKIVYRDAETGKEFTFITNHFRWSASTIAAIYKQRWQVELFFKWIKQNLKIRSFIGTSMNAVITQIMVALCVYLILAWMKFTFSIGKSLMQIARLLNMNLFVSRDLIALLKPLKPKVENSPQLRLAL